MAKLKIRIEFFKGNDVPVHQTAKLFEKMAQFFSTTAEAANIQIPKEEWFGTQIDGGSLNSEVVGGLDVPDAAAAIFYQNISEAIEYGASTNGLVASAPPRVLHGYAEFAKNVHENDVINIAVPVNGGRKTYQVTPTHAVKIHETIPQHVTYSGGAQGVIYNFTPGASKPFFQLKELSTGRRIHCGITDALYETVVDVLMERLGVVFVEGLVKENFVQGKIESIDVTNVLPAPHFTEKDFLAVFGCDPDFTGGGATDDHLRRFRGHDD